MYTAHQKLTHLPNHWELQKYFPRSLQNAASEREKLIRIDSGPRLHWTMEQLCSPRIQFRFWYGYGTFQPDAFIML